MAKWYNLIPFDMIADLAFGVSFDGLKNNTIHTGVCYDLSTCQFHYLATSGTVLSTRHEVASAFDGEKPYQSSR